MRLCCCSKTILTNPKTFEDVMVVAIHDCAIHHRITTSRCLRIIADSGVLPSRVAATLYHFAQQKTCHHPAMTVRCERMIRALVLAGGSEPAATALGVPEIRFDDDRGNDGQRD